MSSIYRYITTPIYYVNDVPHIGHLYTSLAGDMIARFYRMKNYKTFFLTGTDEHGGKVESMALSLGRKPQDHVDIMAQSFKDLAQIAHISYDDFIRTSEDRHKKAAQHLWKCLKDQGHIYEGFYEGWYAQRDEAFYDEKELTTLENGGKIAPTGAEVLWLQEPCFFFRLSSFREKLLAFYDQHKDSIGPKSRYNEVVSFLKGDLKDLAISRSRLTWGIEVPQDTKSDSQENNNHNKPQNLQQSSSEAEPCHHVMYVWIDALTNYITALGYPKQEKEEDFRGFWAHSLHLIGKDILRFHAVYWPAFLIGAGLEPPKRIFAHGWWTREGQKMSKSLGNGLDPFGLIKNYGLDPLRYFLLSHITFGSDGDFSFGLFVQKCNEGLSDTLGNLCQRVLSFVHSKMPRSSLEKTFDPLRSLWLSAEDLLHHPQGQALTESMKNFVHKGSEHLQILENFIDRQELEKYVGFLMSWVQEGNLLVNVLAPWVLLKEHPWALETQEPCPPLHKLLQQGLWSLLYGLRNLAVCFYPLIPQTSLGMLQQITGKIYNPEDISFDILKESLDLDHLFPLQKPTPLFKKLENPVSSLDLVLNPK